MTIQQSEIRPQLVRPSGLTLCVLSGPWVTRRTDRVEPHSRETYENSFKWVAEHDIFEGSNIQ